MTGYELRLWRKGLGWSRDRAAEELGICLRSYKAYENANLIRRNIALATVSLTIRTLIPEFDRKRMSGQKMRQLLDAMLRDATYST
ncbi:XRE family transcriptional regulator [Salmonella enterica]|nr:XRE family transcriptional regulator [Salmonella enterica]EBF4221234.1 XRE family transcriptional regulator [Salmonella enterica]ECD9475739.1 XRE family transcriptional regulator [Salmonella enterica subsp. houtenae]ECD9477343.1 XRE family transcriptional regulator [Salmonella enterica subsp. houtenae]